METTERVERSRRAWTTAREAGVPIGRKPYLSESAMEEIRRLWGLGFGYTAIGRAVRNYRKSDGTMRPTAAATVKRVIEGEYESREAYERRVYEAKAEIARLAELEAM